MRFDSKIFVIEDMRELDKLTNDDLHGTPTAYKMRIEDKPLKREATFKVAQRGKEKVHEPNNEFCEIDKEDHFTRRLKKGAGKSSIVCYNCGRLGYFSSKCLEVKMENIKNEKITI